MWVFIRPVLRASELAPLDPCTQITGYSLRRHLCQEKRKTYFHCFHSSSVNSLEASTEFPPTTDVFHGGGVCASADFLGTGFSLAGTCFLLCELRGKRVFWFSHTFQACLVCSVLTILSPPHNVVLSGLVPFVCWTTCSIERRDGGAAL